MSNPVDHCNSNNVSHTEDQQTDVLTAAATPATAAAVAAPTTLVSLSNLLASFSEEERDRLRQLSTTSEYNTIHSNSNSIHALLSLLHQGNLSNISAPPVAVLSSSSNHPSQQQQMQQQPQQHNSQLNILEFSRNHHQVVQTTTMTNAVVGRPSPLQQQNTTGGVGSYVPPSVVTTTAPLGIEQEHQPQQQPQPSQSSLSFPQFRVVEENQSENQTPNFLKQQQHLLLHSSEDEERLLLTGRAALPLLHNGNSNVRPQLLDGDGISRGDWNCLEAPAVPRQLLGEQQQQQQRIQGQDRSHLGLDQMQEEQQQIDFHHDVEGGGNAGLSLTEPLLSRNNFSPEGEEPPGGGGALTRAASRAVSAVVPTWVVEQGSQPVKISRCSLMTLLSFLIAVTHYATEFGIYEGWWRSAWPETKKSHASGSDDENAAMHRLSVVTHCASKLLAQSKTQDTLNDFHSPQLQAVLWLVSETALVADEDTNKCVWDSEFGSMFALQILRYSVGLKDASWQGKETKASTSAISKACSWARVTCNHDRTAVTQLTFNNANLSGTIPVEIAFGLGPHLEHFNAVSNQGLTGNIPVAMGTAMTALTSLELQKTAVTGTIPSELGFVTSLRTLLLDHTLLHGTVPDSLCNRINSDQLKFNIDATSVKCSCCASDKDSTIASNDDGLIVVAGRSGGRE